MIILGDRIQTIFSLSADIYYKIVKFITFPYDMCHSRLLARDESTHIIPHNDGHPIILLNYCCVHSALYIQCHPMLIQRIPLRKCNF